MKPIKVKYSGEIFTVREDGPSMSITKDGEEVARCYINEDGNLIGRKGIKGFYSAPVDEGGLKGSIGQLIKSLSLSVKNEEMKSERNEIGLKVERLWIEDKKRLMVRVKRQEGIEDITFEDFVEEASVFMPKGSGTKVLERKTALTNPMLTDNSLMARLAAGKIKVSINDEDEESSESVQSVTEVEVDSSPEVPTVQVEEKSFIQRMKEGAPISEGSESLAKKLAKENSSGAMSLIQRTTTKGIR